MSDPKVAYSVEEAAEMLSLGETYFRASVLPELRVVRSGRRILVPRRSLEKWCDALAERPVPR
jgi:excisionase family DNA binding protein